MAALKQLANTHHDKDGNLLYRPYKRKGGKMSKREKVKNMIAARAKKARKTGEEEAEEEVEEEGATTSKRAKKN